MDPLEYPSLNEMACQRATDTATCNDEEMAVFALVHDGPLRLIIGFQKTIHTPPDSLQSRVVACFNNIHLNGGNFPNRVAMREAMFNAFSVSWSPGLFKEIEADSVFWICAAKHGQPVGQLVRETGKFQNYTSLLRPMSSLLPKTDGDCCPAVGIKCVVFKELVHLDPLVGCGSRTKVEIDGDAAAYKGISFFEFLTVSPEAFQHKLDALYHEIYVVTSIFLEHTFIISPPKTFVIPTAITDSDINDPDPPVCGTIYPFFKNGLLSEAINSKQTISLSQKAKWCYQLVSAIHHVHLRAHSFHMDIKPSNTLLDENKDLVVINWEQCNENSFALAPEADGTFDAAVATNGRLIYTPYSGPTRINNPIGSPGWNVFPIWARECPRAVEMAEVYSLGCALWMLLAQINLEDYHNDGRAHVAMARWMIEASNTFGVPRRWKRAIRECVQKDPNKRMSMRQLMGFWELEMSRFEV